MNPFRSLYRVALGAVIALRNKDPKIADNGLLTRVQYKDASQHVHGVTAGDSPEFTVLFLHGTPGNWSDMSVFLKHSELSKKAQLISIDRPGWGSSGEELCRFSTQARQIKTFLQKHATGKQIVLVGHSLGSPIAAYLMQTDPDLYAGAVLVSGNINPQLGTPRWYNRFSSHRPIRYLLPKRLRKANEEIAMLQAYLREILPFWASVNKPLIVMHGSRDRLVHPTNMEFLQATAPQIELRLYQDEGHFMIWEHPEYVVEAIDDVLDQLTAKSQSTAADGLTPNPLAQAPLAHAAAIPGTAIPDVSPPTTPPVDPLV